MTFYVRPTSKIRQRLRVRRSKYKRRFLCERITRGKYEISHYKALGFRTKNRIELPCVSYRFCGSVFFWRDKDVSVYASQRMSTGLNC